MVNFRKKSFIKFHLGDKKISCHIDAVHAYPPKVDKFTGKIVESIVKKINCSGIISIVSRTVADLNRPRDKKNWRAIDEYRQTIREILRHLNILNKEEKLTKSYLHLAIHGMFDSEGKDIEIGTKYGKTCQPTVKKWFIDKLNKKFDRKIVVDCCLIGDSSKSAHRKGDPSAPDYPGYGKKFNTFQIEISRNLRKKHLEELTDKFSEIILQFNKKFK